MKKRNEKKKIWIDIFGFSDDQSIDRRKKEERKASREYLFICFCQSIAAFLAFCLHYKKIDFSLADFYLFIFLFN